MAGVCGPLSRDIKLFRDHPGVIKIGAPESRKKRGYFLLRIPESVLQKVHEQLRKVSA